MQEVVQLDTEGEFSANNCFSEQIVERTNAIDNSLDSHLKKVEELHN
jgi:hypothetical protein